jgi:hypothetical protein
MKRRRRVMWRAHRSASALSVLVAAIIWAGCASSGPPKSDLESELTRSQQRISELETTLEERDRTLSKQESEISKLSESLHEAQTKTPDVATRPPSRTGESGDLLPPSADPGECYARAFVPPHYQTEQIQLLKRQASERLEVIPARYEWVEERVMVKEATERVEVVAAAYETVTERVIDKPAHTIWKKGRGPIERVDHATGEIMCLVEVPATYKTVTKRVVKTEPTTRTVQIPAEYKTIKVRKLVSAAQTKRIEIPAEYQSLTKRVLVEEGHMEWHPILCETNASRPVVRSVQRALDGAGYDPGPIDGVIGRRTTAALVAFQKAKGLPSGQLTVATLDALGVEANQ